jgi:hypothetical protein
VETVGEQRMQDDDVTAPGSSRSCGVALHRDLGSCGAGISRRDRAAAVVEEMRRGLVE